MVTDLVKHLCVRTSLIVEGESVNAGSGFIIKDNNEFFVVTAHHCIYGVDEEYHNIEPDAICIEHQNGDYAATFKRLEVRNIAGGEKGEDWVLLRILPPNLSVDFSKVKLGIPVENDIVVSFCGYQQAAPDRFRPFDAKLLDRSIDQFRISLTGKSFSQGGQEGLYNAKGLSGSVVAVEYQDTLYIIGFLKSVVNDEALNDDIDCCSISCLRASFLEPIVNLPHVQLNNATVLIMDFSSSDETKELRKLMLGGFDLDSLDTFVRKHINIRLEDVISTTGSKPVVFHQFLEWAVRNNYLEVFLSAVADNHRNDPLKTFAGTLLRAQQASTADTFAQRRYLINGYLIINRNSFWDHLFLMVSASESVGRVLVIYGGIGKSHSRWPIAYAIKKAPDKARLTWVDVDSNSKPDELRFGSTHLIKLLADRIWGDSSHFEIGSLETENRVSHGTNLQFIQRLARETNPIWLVIDGLNIVRPDDSAKDFLSRLCLAVDSGECPNVRLFLIGLDPNDLSEKARRTATDRVNRPSKAEISKYIAWFSKTKNKKLDDSKQQRIVNELDAVLTSQPTKDDWKAFDSRLDEKCREIWEAD